jgi:hypothetical protein
MPLVTYHNYDNNNGLAAAQVLGANKLLAGQLLVSS